MATAFFFTENYLKQNSAVSWNIDYSDIRPFIEPAQDQLIKPRIGAKLYERLMQSIIDSDYNNDELELIKLIRNAVMYYTIYLALPFLQTKIKNAGVVRSTDQYIQTVSKQDMLDLQHQTLNMSNYYMSRLEDWLCLYSSRYPQYADPDPLNKKEYTEPYDLGGFLPYKGTPLNSDMDLILRSINYKKY